MVAANGSVWKHHIVGVITIVDATQAYNGQNITINSTTVTDTI